jgi:hypothetical protein
MTERRPLTSPCRHPANSLQLDKFEELRRISESCRIGLRHVDNDDPTRPLPPSALVIGKMRGMLRRLSARSAASMRYETVTDARERTDDCHIGAIYSDLRAGQPEAIGTRARFKAQERIEHLVKVADVEGATILERVKQYSDQFDSD